MSTGHTNICIHANNMPWGLMVMLMGALTLHCSWFTSSEHWLSFGLGFSSHSHFVSFEGIPRFKGAGQVREQKRHKYYNNISHSEGVEFIHGKWGC